MRRFSVLAVSALLIVMIALSGVVSIGAAVVSLAEVDKTLVEYGDWMIEKIDNDTHWSLVSYIGSGGRVVTPRFFGGMVIIEIADNCFAGDDTVTEVVTDSPMWTIGDYAFLDCVGLESFTCNYALSSIGKAAFSGTSALKHIDLEVSIIKEVSEHCFTYSGLIEVALPKTCLSIGEYAFYCCDSFERIDIPASVTSISDTAFEGCDKLVIYTVTGAYAAEYAEAHGIPYVLTDAPEQPGERYLLGDADGDGEVTILDATKIQRVLVGLDSDDGGRVTMRGDTNRDGLDILDATKIQRFLADFTVTEPIGEYFDTNVLC